MIKEEITVTFLDVGQGDSSVIILPDMSSAIVVDCPHRKDTIDYLEYKKIRNLYVFLTHTDIDHMGGIADLVQNFEQVSLLAYNHDTLLVTKDESKRKLILRQLAQLISRRDIDTSSPRCGQRWNFQGVEVETLHPADKDIKITVPRNDTNNASVVLRITFAQKRILLTADIEGDGWEWIIERNTDLKANILKFPHHGAWYKPTLQQPSLEKVLERIEPSLVILSVGTHNKFGHPNIDTLNLLKKHPQIRLMCTEATEQCYALFKSRTGKGLTCAGNIEIAINNDEIAVISDTTIDSKSRPGFDRVQCELDIKK